MWTSHGIRCRRIALAVAVLAAIQAFLPSIALARAILPPSLATSIAEAKSNADLPEECNSLALEAEAVSLALPELRDPLFSWNPFNRLSCGENAAYASFWPAMGHSNSVRITKFDSSAEARGALGEANETFREFPARHEKRTGYPMAASLEETMAWQMSRWLFSVASFDDTDYRIAIAAPALAERVYQSSLQVGLGDTPTPTPIPTSVPGMSSHSRWILFGLLLVIAVLVWRLAAGKSARTQE